MALRGKMSPSALRGTPVHSETLRCTRIGCNHLRNLGQIVIFKSQPHHLLLRRPTREVDNLPIGKPPSDKIQSDAIRCHQRQAEASRGRQIQAETSRDKQMQSEARRGKERLAEASRGDQLQPEARGGKKMHSVARRGTE